MNGNFNADINKFKSRKGNVITFTLCIILGIFVASYGFSKKTLQCAYNNQKAYDCQRNLKIFGINFGTKNFSNITAAISVSKRNRHGRLDYQLQFVNKNGEHIKNAHSWTDYNVVNKDVTEINKHFEEGKNFSYIFVREWFFAVLGLFIALFPFLLYWLLLHTTWDLSNTGFGNFDAQKFIKKDLSKMTDEEVMAFIKQRDKMEK
jgi:hypothetical protein